MPTFGGNFDYGLDIAPRSAMGAPSDSDIARGVDIATPQYRSTTATLLGATALALPDLIDTVSSSLGLTDRGELNQNLMNAIDSPGLTRFQRDIAGATEIASGVAGIIGSELVARRITAPAGFIARTATKLPYFRRLAAMDEQYAVAMQTVRNVDMQLARAGTLGAEQFAGKAVIEAGEITRRSAVFNARLLGAGVAARNAAVTEGIMGLTLNQNSFLYTDSAAWNLGFVAAGIALPAGVEWLYSGYKIRKAQSAADLLHAQAEALDPSGAERTRLLWRGAEKGDEGTLLHGMGGGQTDQVTSLLLETQTLRSELIPDGVDARQLMGNRERLAVQKLQLAREKIASVTTRGLSTDGRTRFTIGVGDGSGRVAGAPGYANHINEIMARDPTGFYLVEQMGGIPDELPVSVLVEKHKERIAERQAEIAERLADETVTELERDKLRLQQQLLEQEAKQTPAVFIDGERLPVTEASVLEGFIPPSRLDFEFVPDTARDPAIKLKGPRGFWGVKNSRGKAIGTVDADLKLQLHGNRKLEQLDHFDFLRLYRLGDYAARELAKSKEIIKLSDSPNWFELDLAEEVLRRSNGAAQVEFPAGMTRDSAQVESYAQKAELFGKIDAAMTANKGRRAQSAEKLSPDQMMARLRVQLNLPRRTAYEMGVTSTPESPVTNLLRGASRFGPDEIRKMSLVDLKRTVAEFQRLGDMAPITARDVESLSGNSFTYMLDRNGQEMKPIVAMLRPAKPFEWVSDNVAERIAMQQIVRRNILLSEDADGYTRMLAQAMEGNPDAIQAAMTHEIRDTQLMGAVTSSAPTSGRGAAANAFITSEMRDRDAPVLLAASRLRDTIDRIGNNFVSKVFADAMGDRLNQLANPRNTKTNLLLDEFHSFAAGWDLAKAPIPRDGFWAFKLADSEANRARWRQTHGGEEMPKGQLLVTPRGTTVVLDDLGLDVQQRFNALTKGLADAKNTLLRSQGMREIDFREWYVPPPQLAGKHVGFVYGPDGKAVPGMGIVAKTPDEYANKAVAMQPELDKLGLGYTLRSLDDIQQFGNIWDKAIAEMLDPGTTAIQAGKPNRGLLTENQVRVGAFSSAMENIRAQFLRHGRDVIETQFDSSIKAAKQRANIAQATKANGGGLFRNRTFKSAHDLYLENLTGTSKLYSDKSFLGRVYNGIEGSIDDFLKGAAPTAARVWDATGAWFNRPNPFSKTEAAKRDFEALSRELGKYMPFESAAEMIEAKGFGAKPWTQLGMAGKLNSFAAAVTLRFAESAHAIVNVAGLVSAMPAVMRHMGRKLGESESDYLQRIGHVGLTFETSAGPVGVLDMTKLAKRGVKFALSKEAHPYFDDMVRRGMLSQEIAELHKQYGLIEGRNEWEKFFLGDPSVSKAKGFKQNFYRKGVVGWGSILSDKSEDFTRTIASMTGIEMAKMLGITTRESQLSFAHDFANKVIANYTPANRPEVFQGALGTSLGLFQSFVQNYYQRMFRYVETKDWAAIRDAYVWQGAVFGMSSLPGWKLLDSARLSATEGGEDAESELRKRFGGAADLLEGGTLSNLPALFGAPAVNLYSRGDVNPRIPGGQLFQGGVGGESAARQVAELIPAMSILGKISDGISEAISAFSAKNPHLSPTQLGEIASNMMPNRPLAGVIEQFLAGGNDTDRYGQLVSRTTSAMEGVYRIMGLRSMEQAKELEAFYSNRGAQTQQAAAKAVLRQSMRAAIREGRFEEFYDIFQRQYIENGGDPRYFRRTVKEAYEAALETRGERQLETALRNPARADEVTRLLDAGVQLEDDAKENASATDVYGALAQETQEAAGLGDYPGQMTDPDLLNPPS